MQSYPMGMLGVPMQIGQGIRAGPKLSAQVRFIRVLGRTVRLELSEITILKKLNLNDFKLIIKLVNITIGLLI